MSTRPDAASTAAPQPIWLVRHARTDWTGVRWCGRSDPDLSAAGRAAADRLAIEIAGEVRAAGVTGVDVVSSPLRRARATAEAIARALEAPVQVEPDLVEVDFGAADGLTWDELAAAHPSLAEAILRETDPDWPGGETAAEIAARARSIVDRMVEIARSRAVVVVTHGRFVGAIAGHVGAELPPGGLATGSAVRLERVRVG